MKLVIAALILIATSTTVLPAADAGSCIGMGVNTRDFEHCIGWYYNSPDQCIGIYASDNPDECDGISP